MGLLPIEWEWALCTVWTAGSTKYNYDSQETAPWLTNPMEWTRVLSSARRHERDFLGGQSFDPETGCHHMAMRAWNDLVIMSYDLHKIGKDDLKRGFWFPVPAE